MNSTKANALASDLWPQVKNGDRSALYDLYDLFWQQLIKKAHNVVRDGELSKDIVQEIFIDLWERRDTLEINDFGAYIGTAVKYRSLSYLKRKRLKVVHLEVLDQLPEYGEMPQGEVSDLQEEIERAIGQLPSACQNIFRLSRYVHLSNQEIADELDISKRTVETQISKALRFLRQQVLSIF
tara:strand:+ start:47527 stop:48072 length:546 start_codon:yes stop_codon:yes gene_type:complete